jgi:hypothetical protein
VRREEAYAALFKRLEELHRNAGGPLKTVSRRFRDWGSVPSEEQPCLFMTVRDQSPTQAKGFPPVWRLEAGIWLYAFSEDQSAPPGILLNDLIDAVLEKLQHRPGEPLGEGAPFGVVGSAVATTLGGRVSHCWVSSPIVTDEGFEGDQGSVLIPVEMLTILEEEE